MAEVNMDELLPNTREYRTKMATAEEKKPTKEAVKPVVKSENIVTLKKPWYQRATELFIGDDPDSLGSYIVHEIVVPSIQNTILDVLESTFLGMSRRDRRYDSGRGYDYSYPYRSTSSSPRAPIGGLRRNDYGRDRDRDRRDDYRPTNNKVDYKSIRLRYRADAEEVVTRMRELMDLYNQVTVADLLKLVGQPSSYTDNNWGWTDPRDIGIRRVSDGYLIDVAEAQYLE